MTDWIQSEYTKCRQARTQRSLQWQMNMAMFYGQQYLELTQKSMPQGFADKLFVPKKSYYTERKTINKIRSFVRGELNQFMSQLPQAIAVPATSEDQDVRGAYAAEQAWMSISDTANYRSKFNRSIWWMVITGNGFMKTWWDSSALDKASGQQGAICFGNVTPFNLLIPDQLEQDIEDQPFVINAYTKPIGWLRTYWGEALNGATLTPSTTSDGMIVEEAMLNINDRGKRIVDSCTVYECWMKPGAHPLMPNGGMVICVDDTIVSMFVDGMPYSHGMYPFTKFENIPSSTFYADSPLVDLNPLQKEYNKLRSQISEAGHRMARPQLIAAQGSIVTSKMTNEPGAVIEYIPGYQPPQPIPLTPLPQYYVDQLQTIQSDIEDIGGQHDVSKGQAPAGVTAGTAINFLQEADNAYRTPQFQSVEDGTQKNAQMAVELFVQYVDVPRKIKTIGADSAFDTMLLTGEDLKGGTDIRIQKGSGIATSKAANDAKVMDMFNSGLITDPNLALQLLEVGGPQKVLDIMNVAERKAQRENIKMKMLTPQMIQQAQDAWDANQLQQAQGALGQLQQSAMQPLALPAGPGAAATGTGGGSPDMSGGGALGGPSPAPQGTPIDPAASSMGASDPSGPPPMPGTEPMPPVINVDDFDVHEQHIVTHNAFRMSQEYDTLDPVVKDQFKQHVALHQQYLMQKQLQGFLQSIPDDGTGGGAPAGPPSAGGGDPSAPPAPQGPPGATLAGNGAAPDMSQTGGQ